MIDLRYGRHEDVLRDTHVDTLITDPPYGQKTHDGHAAGVATSQSAKRIDSANRQHIDYAHWTEADVVRFVASWAPRVRGWMVALTSHDLIPIWQEAYETAGRYAFHPIPCVIKGMTVRLGGDGPSSWAVYACVSRPRTKEYAKWGTLPGAYVGGRGERTGGGQYTGGKPLWLMNALVRDYSRPGRLVCDPCAGWGTTLIGAESLGRDAIGAECDRDTYEAAQARIARPMQRDLFS